MIVVADTGPLNYLIQIDCDSLLPQLYGRIMVPPALIQELSHPAAPPSIAAWLINLPSWVEVRPTAVSSDEELADLDLGERQAIQLAEEQHANLLLIDERKGRRRARERGLRTTGTLGVLLTAGEQRLLDPKAAYRRLISETTFRTSPELEAQFLDLLRLPL